MIVNVDYMLVLNAVTIRQWTLPCRGLRLAKLLDSREDIVGVVVTEVVDSDSGFLPSHVSQEILW